LIALGAVTNAFYFVDDLDVAVQWYDALLAAVPVERRSQPATFAVCPAPEPEAYALASMAVSFRVTRYAQQAASAYSSTPRRPFTPSSPRTCFATICMNGWWLGYGPQQPCSRDSQRD
jgi:hypothetical protein